MAGINVIHNVCDIEGLCVIEPRVFADERGYFFESYHQKEFCEQVDDLIFVQDNEVFSRKGVLRGLHVNVKHPQAKLIHVVKGEIFDVAVDLRKNSPTFKKWYAICLSDRNHRHLYIPEGFGHGYYVLEDSYISFKATTHYIPDDEIGFAWNSKEFAINWPIEENTPIMNERDKCSPDFSEILTKLFVERLK